MINVKNPKKWKLYVGLTGALITIGTGVYTNDGRPALLVFICCYILFCIVSEAQLHVQNKYREYFDVQERYPKIVSMLEEVGPIGVDTTKLYQLVNTVLPRLLLYRIALKKDIDESSSKLYSGNSRRSLLDELKELENEIRMVHDAVVELEVALRDRLRAHLRPQPAQQSLANLSILSILDDIDDAEDELENLVSGALAERARTTHIDVHDQQRGPRRPPPSATQKA